ncbi:TetR/AcrR family transcriptional regulator [Nocardia sp. NPDC049149]|uniref:TetR/AcrR family transcriptional regulator n=1 Tax=Nocardia sp. NPDC049149 TaxID=3364315 RepID=UPI003710F1FF
MGNREDLLAAARTCIYQRGFAGTTARHIASTAGVSLAAIGYHFGSKDQLVTEALTQAIGDGIGNDLEALMRRVGAGRSLPDAFAETWSAIGEIFARHKEGMIASAENMIRLRRVRADREYLTGMNEQAVGDIAVVLGEVHPELSVEQVRAVAQLYFVLLNGLSLHWLSDPAGELPTGSDLATALTALAPCH